MAAFDGWAIVELLGHRVRYGRASEVTMFGEAFCKIEIPSEPPAVEFYSGKALYGIRPASEESIRAYHAPRKLLAAALAPHESAGIDVDEFDADTGGRHDDEPDDDEGDDQELRCGGCRMSIRFGEPTADVEVYEGGSETWHEDCAKANADPVGSDRPRGDP